jgi:hypothetical protein
LEQDFVQISVVDSVGLFVLLEVTGATAVVLVVKSDLAPFVGPFVFGLLVRRNLVPFVGPVVVGLRTLVGFGGFGHTRCVSLHLSALSR